MKIPPDAEGHVFYEIALDALNSSWNSIPFRQLQVWELGRNPTLRAIKLSPGFHDQHSDPI